MTELVLPPPFAPRDHVFLERVPLSLPNIFPYLPTGDWTGTSVAGLSISHYATNYTSMLLTTN
jgi:hypothetical protein